MKLTQHEILSCTPSSCHCLIFSIVHHSFRIVGDGGGSGGGCVVMFLCHCFSYFVCAVVVVELTVKSKIAAADIATATVAARRWRHYISVCLKTSENIFTWAVVFIPYLVIYYYVVLCCAELRSVRQRCIQLLMCLLQLWECHFMNINIAPSLSLSLTFYVNILLCIFCVAVYVAIEYHRLHFHLAACNLQQPIQLFSSVFVLVRLWEHRTYNIEAFTCRRVSSLMWNSIC